MPKMTIVGDKVVEFLEVGWKDVTQRLLLTGIDVQEVPLLKDMYYVGAFDMFSILRGIMEDESFSAMAKVGFLKEIRVKLKAQLEETVGAKIGE